MLCLLQCVNQFDFLMVSKFVDLATIYIYIRCTASVSAFFEVQSTTVNNFHYDSKYDTFSDYQKSH